MAEIAEETRETIDTLLEENAELRAKLAELALTYEDLLLQSIPEAEGLGGIVVRPDTAALGPCTCYDNVCFHKGIIGALNSSERSQYCQQIEKGESPGMVKRVEHWKEAVGVCKGEIAETPRGQRLEPWLRCMGQELSKRGIEI